MTSPSDIRALRVVIVGGGIAAIEALIALHDLGEGRFDLTLVAPADTFVLRPMTVAAPFSAGHATETPLADVCARFGARHHRSAVVGVDAEARQLRCEDGAVLDYDAVVLAIGARAVPAFPAALTFSDTDPIALNGLLRDVEQGYCGSVAVVIPPSGSWALPAYELALLIARHAFDAGFGEMPVHLVTPEPAPLAIFGPAGSEAVAGLLREAHVQVHTDSIAAVEHGGRIAMMPGSRELEVDRVVALPTIEPIPLEGVPTDAKGFIPTDDHGRVAGLEGVYAVGDGADFPVKQGGLATQQADAAARHIAAGAGAAVEPEPFRPVLRAMLLTGSKPRFMRNEPSGGRGEGRVSDSALWWPPVKVFGQYLSGWLAGEEGTAPRPAPEEHVAIDVVLGPERDADPLALEPLGPLPRRAWRG